MSDYQAIYDAVRSRIHGGDLGVVVADVARQSFDISHVVPQITQAIIEAAEQHQRPSVLYRPQLSIDGNQWCALYGDNLQDGVAGFGGAPALAMEAFDRAWTLAAAPTASPQPVPAEPVGERERFEAWAATILGDNPTWKGSGDCELAWQAWCSALSAPPATAEDARDAALLRDSAMGKEKA